ncbi:condensation domain-containing protein [Pendulispora rubella]|uniref:Condensation domain-containing protein n=1 Tax=Pendulispora rubella TaxID=2741070 RepID=A0ABZ2LF20_9BACT
MTQGPASGLESQEPSAPLGFAQQYLWFLLQYPDAGPARLNGNLVIEFHGPLDVPRLEHALFTIEERHEPLRTYLRVEKGQPRQVVAQAANESLRIVDIRPEERETALDAAVRAEMETPLDFVRGPVHRRILLRLGPEEHVLLWTANHINVDFWSYRILISELRELYGAPDYGRPTTLPPLPLRFSEFAHAQRTAPNDERRARFWRSYLEQSECYQPPHRGPRRTRPSPELTRSIPIEPDWIGRIDIVARDLGCTRFSILLAALGLVAHRWSGATDIVSLVASAHRSSQTKHLIGPFADMLPVRVRLSPEQTHADLVRAAQSTILRALLHELPLRKVEDATGRTYRFTFGVTDHLPFYDRVASEGEKEPARRALQRSDAAEIACGRITPDTHFRVWALPMRMYRMDLLFTMERDLLLCTYQPDLFTEEAIDRALRWYLDALKVIFTSPQSAMASMSLLWARADDNLSSTK